jgi:hypothetical protein
MHGPINVKSNNTNKLQAGFNSAFKGLKLGHKQGKALGSGEGSGLEVRSTGEQLVICADCMFEG